MIAAGNATGQVVVRNPNYHVGFDRPESWGLKYFASTTLLSGLEPPTLTGEQRHAGSINISLETGWVPQLDAGQERIGFNGKAPQDLNKVPILVRPVVRIGLPWKLTAVAAAPPPFEMFGVRAHLLALGLERPIVERGQWTLGWRVYGQLGSVKGAFSCPASVAAFAPGSPENPTRCTGESADVATLRYVGSEFQFSYRPRSMPKLVPHVAVGGNWIDGAMQLRAPVPGGLDETRQWTRGGTFSTTFGASYLLTSKAAFTVDGFYSPLWVQRTPGGPRTNDGLFNVRALVSYTFR
jgi:hypothetical protein